jgi:hypothetical protein
VQHAVATNRGRGAPAGSAAASAGTERSGGTAVIDRVVNGHAARTVLAADRQISMYWGRLLLYRAEPEPAEGTL